MKVTAIVVQSLIGVALFAFGRWGARHASVFAPASLPSVERERREQVAARGARACQFAGVCFAAMNLVLFF